MPGGRKRDFKLYDRLQAKQKALGIWRSWMTHSVTERSPGSSLAKPVATAQIGALVKRFSIIVHFQAQMRAVALNQQAPSRSYAAKFQTLATEAARNCGRAAPDYWERRRARLNSKFNAMQNLACCANSAY